MTKVHGKHATSAFPWSLSQLFFWSSTIYAIENVKEKCFAFRAWTTTCSSGPNRATLTQQWWSAARVCVPEGHWLLEQLPHTLHRMNSANPGDGPKVYTMARPLFLKLRTWTKGWSTSPVRTGWESWGCSAWRRQGSGEALLQSSSTWRGPIGKMGTIFLARRVVTGQGAMALNYGRVDLDWI